jgi:glycosyltransferase involved in cell wall biosynthesis
MRIAVLATHFADYSFELASELANEHEVLLVADGRNFADECGDLIPGAGVRLMLLDQSRRDRRLFTELRVALALSRFRPDLVVAHEHPHPHVTRMQRRAAALAPLTLVVHDPEPHEGRDAAFADRRRSQIRQQRDQARRLFAHGPYCANRLRAAVGPAKPIVSIPHGPILRPKTIELPPGGRRILMFGRMEAYKGLDLLLEACRRLANQGRPASLHLAGRGPELDRLRADFAALPHCEIDSRFLPREAVIAAMTATDIVVTPYRQATQSGVVAAAFANGRPVLATRVGGLPDFVRDGENGRLAPPDDAAALADMIATWPAGPRNGAHALWRGALAASQTTIHWRIAAQAMTDLV